MWLPGRQDLQYAADEAKSQWISGKASAWRTVRSTMRRWLTSTGPPRSSTGDLDGAAIAIGPVLDLPPELLISRIVNHLVNFRDLLATPPLGGSRDGQTL